MLIEGVEPMGKRELSSMLIKLAAVYRLAGNLSFLLLSLNSICFMRDCPTEPWLSQLRWVLLTLSPIFALLIDVFMLVGSDWIAAKMFRNERQISPAFALSFEELLSVAFCCIGLLVFIDSLPKLLHSVSGLIRLNQEPGIGLLETMFGLETTAHACGIALQAMVGIILFLQAQRMAKFCRKRHDKIKREATTEQ
jgi:hypothetical protein